MNGWQLYLQAYVSIERLTLQEERCQILFATLDCPGVPCLDMNFANNTKDLGNHTENLATFLLQRPPFRLYVLSYTTTTYFPYSFPV